MGGIRKSTKIVGNFNTSHSLMDRTTRQKIKKYVEGLNNITYQLDLTDMYRTFHQQKQKTHFSQEFMEYSTE